MSMLPADAHRRLEPAELPPPGWKHVANEWADMAINGVQHLRNLMEWMNNSEPPPADGFRSSQQLRSDWAKAQTIFNALKNMEACLKHCREVQERQEKAEALPATPEPIPRGVYYLVTKNNFFNHIGYGMGEAFYDKWEHRASEFPQSRMDSKLNETWRA